MKVPYLSGLTLTLVLSLLAIGRADAATMGTISACVDCHGTNPQANAAPVESTQRNNPDRGTIGSHAYHINTVLMTCSGCHVVPSAMDHRNKNIDMATPMAGGVTYSAAVSNAVPQDNQLTSAGLGTCSGTTCHNSGSAQWGSVETCSTCHGYPPVTTSADTDNRHVSGATAVNHIGTGASVNTKDSFNAAHGGCQLCHGTESTTDGTGNTHAPHANYNVSLQHGTGNINMNGPTGTGTGYNSSNRGCDAACHANDATHRMTSSGKTLTFGVYGSGMPHATVYPGATHMAAPSATTPATSTCVACHNVTLAGPYPATTLGSAPNCMGCHKQGLVLTGTTTSCQDCHGTAASAGRPTGNAFPNYSGAHTRHVVDKGLSCAQCHANGGTGSTRHGQSNRINSTNITFVEVSSSTAAFRYSGNGVCSNSYCHSTVQSATGTSTGITYRTITWNGGNLSCSSCHGNDTATLTTGSHTRHIATGSHAAITCSACHNGYTATTVTEATHVNNQINVSFAAGTFTNGSYADPTGAAGNGFSSCSATYCHSSVQSASGGTPPNYRTVTWGTTLTCQGCHGNDSATLTSGSHSAHINAVYGFSCADCHGAAGSGNTTLHVNNTINVDLTNRGATAAYTGGTVPQDGNSGTCNNSNCHGKNSQTWGAAGPTNGVCTTCHGQFNYAYFNLSAAQIAPGGTGVDTGGNTAASSPRVGAHQAHLLGSSNISAPMHCGECHTVHTTVADATHLNMTTATVGFNGVLARSHGKAASATKVSGIINCSNACHSSGDRVPGTGAGQSGLASAPVAVWNNSTLIGGTTVADTCSAKCHQVPPGAGVSGDTHQSYAAVTTFATFATVCAGCHGETLSATPATSVAGIFADKTKHIDGKSGGTGCSSCHGFPPTSNAHTVHVNNIISENGLSGLSSVFVDNVVCGVCHNVSALTKHAGSFGNDGTSRNIYLPSPSTLQSSYQFGPNPVSYDKGGTTTCSNISCHLGGSNAWGDPPTGPCQACHGYPPVTTAADIDNKHVSPNPVNHIGTGATVNTKSTFVSQHGGCQICHGTQDSGSGTHSPASYYDVAIQHNTGLLNMNGPTGSGIGYNSSNRGCDAACHANDPTHRMTASGMTLTFGAIIGGGCIPCHSAVQGSRDAVVGEFGLAWGHKKSGRGSVTTADCIVCHLEGNYSTQNLSSYHNDGKIDLRDPDGAGETPITNISGGAFTFTKFVTSYAAGSRTNNGHTSNTDIANVITQKFCNKCHDANGATNPTARSNNGGTGTQYMPFGGINLGATYTVANGAAAAGGIINVASQFLTTNSSYHPLSGPLNRDFPAATRLVAPYNNNGSRAGTSGTKTLSVVLNCFDCHNTPTALTTRTIIAHGNAAGFRGTVYAGASAVSTLCTTCHTGYTVAGTHSTGSAWSATGSSHNAARGCESCHASQTGTTRPSRPLGAQDYHGNNALVGGGLWPTVNSRPYAFIRGWSGGAYHRPLRSSEFTTGSATCGAGTCPTNGNVGDGSTRTYTAGGSY